MKRMDVMNGYDHVRALLYAYPMAEMLARAVRDGAKVRAALSFRNQRDTLSVMESIAADMEYADRLLHWKEQLERAISYCGEEERFLLEYKYFRRGKHLDGEQYATSIYSFTKQREFPVIVGKRFLGPKDRVLILDDFLANGKALEGLLEICELAGAQVQGIGIAIEKAFQGGGDRLRARGYRVESLARVGSMDAGAGTIEFLPA